MENNYFLVDVIPKFKKMKFKISEFPIKTNKIYTKCSLDPQYFLSIMPYASSSNHNDEFILHPNMFIEFMKAIVEKQKNKL